MAIISMFLKFIFLYLLLFYVLPLSIQKWRKEQNWKDRFFISLIHSHVFFILIVHLLVVIKIYETLSIGFVSVVFYLLLVSRRRKEETLSPTMKIIVDLLSAIEKKGGMKEWKENVVTHFILKTKQFSFAIVDKVKKHPIALLSIFVLFILSAYIRFYHSFKHAYFASADPYVHLKWSKLLGQNQIYVDGVYPYGYEAIISILATTFNIDPYTILRFLGPLSGVLIVFSLYYVIRKHQPTHYMIAIFTLLIYFISSFQFPFIWRQISSLSMEYGVIFLLPGLHFFIEYLKKKEKQSLFLSIECFLLTVLIHPYAAICLFIGLVILFIVGLKHFTISHLGKMVSGFFIAGLIGTIPLFIGLLAGKGFHGESLRFVTESVTTNSTQTTTTFSIDTLISSNFHLVLFLLAIIVLGVLTTLGKKREWLDSSLLLYCVVGFMMYFLYKAEVMGLPSIMMAYRIEVFMTLLTSITIACFILIFTHSKKRLWFEIVTIVSFLIISYLTIPSLTLPKGSMYQYDEALKSLYQIKEEYPIKEWTVVSSIEEYPFTIDYGWHYNLTDFVFKLSSGNELKFTSKDIFIFVEKIPIGTSTTINTFGRTNLSLPFREDPLDFYRIPEYRTQLNENALFWIETTQQKHPDLLDVYFESEHFAVYHFVQDPNNPINLTSLIE